MLVGQIVAVCHGSVETVELLYVKRGIYVSSGSFYKEECLYLIQEEMGCFPPGK